MNPQSLHALVIDRHFGELSPEAAELLDHHLAQHPEARAEAERILESLTVTGDVVLQHPELARVSPVRESKTAPSWRPALAPWMMRAAALVLLVGLAATLGFLAGRSGDSRRPQPPMLAAAAPSALTSPAKEGPWARYRMTFDPTGQGMQVVRVDAPASTEKALR